MENLLQKLMLGGSTAALVSIAAYTSACAQPVGSSANDTGVEQVTVTGTSIRGVAPVGSNVVTVDQKAIEATGAVNVQQLLQTVTSISTANAAPQGESVYSFYAPQIHSLAGSASNSTLVIVDGLRLPGGGTQGYVETDPNIIPTIAIQRVEVLADGASSIYGSDAVAGVINFITRKEYDGLLLQAQAGFGDSYSTNTFGALFGTHWNEGNVLVAANYTYQSALANSARNFVSMGDYTSLGGSNLGRVFGCPTAAFSVSAPAGSGSGIYLSPSSTTTVANSRPNYNCNNTVYGDDLPESIRQNVLMKINQNFGSRLTTSVMFNANILKSYRNSGPGTLSSVTVYGPGSGKGGQINPFFQAPAGFPTANTESINWVDLMGNGPNGTDFGHTEAEEDSMYAQFLASYQITDNWEAKFSDALGWDQSSNAAINAFCSACATLELNGTALSNASTTATDVSGQNTITLNTPLTTANSLDVWNPAGASNKTSTAALLNLYRGKTQTVDVNTHNQMKLDFNGPLFDMPAGPVKVAVGGEIVNYHLIHDRLTAQGTGPTDRGLSDLTFRYKRVVYSGYAEFNVPVFSPEMNIPLVNKLDIDVSARYDDYTDVGSTFNPKYAMNWEVTPGLKLRANYSTSFVAPPMGVIGDPALGGMYSGGASVTNGGITIPVAAYPTVTQLPGCASATVSCTLGSGVQGLGRQFGGGLSNIRPQTGNGWSVGADLAPDFLPGFSSHITLFNNAFKGGVSTPTIGLVTSTAALQHQLTICPTGCTQTQIDAFTRVPNGAIFVGNVPTTVYFLFNHDEANVVYLSIQGLDLQAQYEFDTDYGHFSIADGLTEFTKFDQNAGGGPSFSVLNTSGLNVTFPSVQTQNRLSLGWSMDGLELTGFVNYTGSYRYNGNTAVGKINYDSNGNYASGGDKVHSNTTFDFHGAYDFAGGWGDGLQVYVDVKNLFNTDPPFVNGNNGGVNLGANGYNAFVSNPIGRVTSIGVRKTF
jgi:iron complex outermembrane receptor protein